MLFILVKNQCPEWLSWLQAEDTLLLRGEAVYLQRHLEKKRPLGTLYISQADLLVRGLQGEGAFKPLSQESIQQLLRENPQQLCQS